MWPRLRPGLSGNIVFKAIACLSAGQMVLQWDHTEDSLFTAPPGDLGRVFEQHALPQAAPDTYPIAHGALPGSLAVTLDGASVGGWSYDPGAVSFAAPPVGSTLEISYALPGGCQP